LAVATFVAAPVLSLAIPAHADDVLDVADPPSTDTTTTTTVPEPAPLEGTPTTTPSTEVTTPTTEVTVPTTEPTTDTSTPPSTETTSTTQTTTPTTVPADVPVVTPTTGPPRGGSSGTSTRENTRGSDAKAGGTTDAPLVLLTVGSTQDSPLLPPGAGGGFQAVIAPFTRPLASSMKGVTAIAHGTFSATLGGDISPVSSDKTWGGLASAGPRFAPWIVLLAMAWIVRSVIGSILADRTAGPRRRRWTLL